MCIGQIGREQEVAAGQGQPLNLAALGFGTTPHPDRLSIASALFFLHNTQLILRHLFMGHIVRISDESSCCACNTFIKMGFIVTLFES